MGRLPANTTALIAAEPADAGAWKSCMALSLPLPVPGAPSPATKAKYGIISYYAAQALPGATTLEAWRRALMQRAVEDAAAGHLSRRVTPRLVCTGNSARPLPGAPSLPPRSPRR